MAYIYIIITLHVGFCLRYFPVSPSISVTTSNNSEIIERNNVTLTCFVSSNPVSDIKLHNMTNNETMDTINNVNQAQYQFINTNCLDTGDYMFTANNDIPEPSYKVTLALHIDVMCKYDI